MGGEGLESGLAHSLWVAVVFLTAVLAWFLAPGALAAGLVVGFAMLLLPIIQVVAAFGFMLLLITAFGLGLGDTWADWRRRARPTQ